MPADCVPLMVKKRLETARNDPEVTGNGEVTPEEWVAKALAREFGYVIEVSGDIQTSSYCCVDH